VEGVIYLLDTDTLVSMIRGLKSARRPAVRKQAEAVVKHCREAQVAGHLVGLSAITVSELEFGARHSGDYEAEIAAVHQVLAPFEIFDYDAVACPVHYGAIRQDLDAKGIPIGAMDLLIGAHALALNATLVSNNQAHFSRVTGLMTANWLVS
jgi:tRNA(fMet)-specific endonuclease VapC